MKKGVVLAAAVVVMIVAAVVPVATAAANLDISADTYTAGETAKYTMVADGFSYSGTLEITGTIPAGYAVKPPNAGEVVAMAKFYNETGGEFATVFFNASSLSPGNTIDVHVINGFSATSTIEDVDYAPGGVTTVEGVTSGNFSLKGSVKLPTSSTNGTMYADVKLPDWVTVTKVEVTTGKLVKNPEGAGNYSPTVAVNGESAILVGGPIHITPPTALPAITPGGLFVLVGILCGVLAVATRRK